MTLYFIRLKNYPDVYVGKESPSYALRTDKRIESDMNYRGPRTKESVLQLDAHWWTTKKKAKIWQNETALKRFLSYCNGQCDTFSILPYEEHDLSGSFNEYEVIVYEDGHEEIFSANSFLPKRK